MPELKPLPCPACNNVKTITLCANIAGRMMWFVECADDNCAHHGKACSAESAAITAWNALPRALKWTTEPPKVEHVGTWFWSKIPGQRMAVPVIVAEVDGVLGIGRGTSEQGLTMETCREFGVKFAGPIPTPLEPGES